jgi:phosphatidylserine/phosphatidylglycerophosphate/cardiolipin synthase-like enzyme
MIVIDHWDAQNCVVITGNHNLNRRSSCRNEENLIILRGLRDVALAFATHALDVTLFYRWRWHLQQDAKCPVTKRGDVWGALEETDEWQDKYFSSEHPAYHDAALLSPTVLGSAAGLQGCRLRG